MKEKITTIIAIGGFLFCFAFSVYLFANTQATFLKIGTLLTSILSASLIALTSILLLFKKNKS